MLNVVFPMVKLEGRVERMTEVEWSRERERGTKEENRNLEAGKRRRDKGRQRKKTRYHLLIFLRKMPNSSHLSQALGLIRHKLLQPPQEGQIGGRNSEQNNGEWISDTDHPQQSSI